MVHLQTIASHVPDIWMVYGTGRWAHFNAKLHFCKYLFKKNDFKQKRNREEGMTTWPKKFRMDPPSFRKDNPASARIQPPHYSVVRSVMDYMINSNVSLLKECMFAYYFAFSFFIVLILEVSIEICASKTDNCHHGSNQQDAWN